MQKTDYIWKNGSLVKWEDANTHVLTHTLHYGCGVFEGIRAYQTQNGPAIFRAKEHYDRLLESAKAYHLDVTYSSDQFIEATQDLINTNHIDSCYIRPLIYSGYGAMGIVPKQNPVDIIIAVWGWGAYLGDEGLKNGIHCTMSPWQKTSNSAMPSTAKSCANYANSFLAKHEALQQGFDEAILLNSKGTVAEGPGENIFVIKDDAVRTPPISDDVLRGITRDTMIQLLKENNISIKEESITLDELLSADELFFTGTAAEVTPIRQIDDTVIGNGSRGPVTENVQSQYFDIVNGRSEKHQHWLTYCKEQINATS